MERVQTCALPTRSTDEDRIEQFSSEEEIHVASLLQREFSIYPASLQRRSRTSWRLWWEQFAPQL
eukprot:2672734-Amphidinium_carterae.1